MLESLAQWLRKAVRRQEPKAATCLSCGCCCEQFGWHLRASPADIERWRSHGREDLLVLVNRLGWIWTDPQTGRHLESCPFLQSTGSGTRICAIHDIKPDICRSYPTLAHARRCLKGVFISWGTVVLSLLSEVALVIA